MSSQIPAELRYTDEHEWARRISETTVQVGITDYAQAALGDVVFVQLPHVGDAVASGEPMGEVESTKSVSDLYAPVSGTISAINPELADRPELVNSEPYGLGWLVEISVDDATGLDSQLGDTLDSSGYASLTGE